MDALIVLARTGLTTLAWLAGFAVVFGILGRWMPCNPGMHWWKDLRAAGTDLLYWFVGPLVLRMGRLVLLIGAVALLFGGHDPQVLPVKSWPLWQQCVAVLLLQDVLLYGIHRAFHSRWAWKFHAIHHSPKVLDWLTTQRFHPLNDLAAFSVADVAVLLLGFAPETLFILAPFNLVYSALVHANLNWTFGPLRYVFASPVFHRWHHALQEQGRDKNFASTFPVLDLIFGTFFMPSNQLPEEFGIAEPDFPSDFGGQLMYPFRRQQWQGARGWYPALGLLGTGIVILVALLLGTALFTVARPREEQPVGSVEESSPIQSLGEEPDRSSPILSMAISGDGKRLVTGRGDGTLTIWHAGTGQEQRSLRAHTRPVRSVAFTADGQRIISTCDDGNVKVWAAETGALQLSLAGHSRAVLSVAVSPDGQRIVTGSADLTARIWNARTGEEEAILGKNPGAVLSVTFSTDGRRVIVASGDIVKVWNTESRHEELVLEGHTDLVCCVATSPDSRWIVSGSYDERIKVWDTLTGQVTHTLQGHVGPVHAVALGADMRHVVSGGADGTVKVWDLATGHVQFTLRGHHDAVTSVAISPDGQHIASASRDGTLRVWPGPACKPTACGAVRDTATDKAGK